MKKVVISILIVAVIAFAIFLIMRSSGYSNTASNSSQTYSSQAPSQKFSDQPYYSKSYLISDATLDPQAQAAISGFQLSRDSQADGSIVITLKALKPEYQDQKYTLQPGQQLYFIERTMGDDGGGNEGNIADDSAVVVDASGLVVQPPATFQ